MKQRRRIGWLALLLALVLSVQAQAATPTALVPVGTAVGIQLQTDGIVVTGLEEDAPARSAGLKTGDVIRSVNGSAVTTAAELAKTVRESGGEALTISALRKGKPMQVSVKPAAVDGGYRLGLLIRDAIAGIGTVTFYDPKTGTYGALGHGVSDSSSAQLLPLADGKLVQADVVGVNRGQRGSPGQLQGAFDPQQLLGTVTQNASSGIFGQIELDCTMQDAIPVADRSEITTGAASILCMVSGGEVREYSVEITRLYPLHDSEGRNLMLTVTDPELIEQTGGIVQGMSGSPILQNGKLIGAVTHVLVGEPTQGYGIFIDAMLRTAYSEE
jgi:stage IV sporulation protein B